MLWKGVGLGSATTMDNSSPVEELAWLVKDNLYSKHLVLSVEELFVEFLEFPLIEEETLALEPMESYQRMLLHRLADLFELAHESVGEGDERHLVVEKCEDSLIPAVLVSDILEIGNGDTQHPDLSRQLMKRATRPADGFQTPPASKQSMLSLEERQAAYVTARQRIFSRTQKYSEQTSQEAGSARPRSDPVVARRMIAHALGKPKVLAFTSPSTGFLPAQDVELQSVVSGDPESSCRDNPGNAKVSNSVELKESMQQSSAKAAKRMFANALGLPHTGTSQRETTLQVSCTQRMLSPVEDMNSGDVVTRSENFTSIPADLGEVAYQGCPRSSGRRVDVTPLRVARRTLPGGAACRIFSQALGLRGPICSTDVNRPASITNAVPF